MGTTIRWSLVALLIASSTVSGQFQPPNRTPPPQGQDIVARDGDRVIIEDDARVRIVRRRQAVVRTVFSSAERSLMLLIDYPPVAGEAPEGRVDTAYNYFEVQGDWLLGDRWEGTATIEEYSSASDPGTGGLGLITPLGLVQLQPFRPPDSERSDPAVISVISYREANGGGAGWVSFDQAEQHQIAQAAQRGAMAQPGNVTGGVMWSSMAGAIPGGSNGAAIRVGGNAGPPMKIYDVPPAYPEAARQAGVRGVVILEITIGEDGSVTDARVLRGIPLLDAAALEAARQWRYQPMVVGGKPVPVITTTAVMFPDPSR
jgi:TonB family protein